MQAGEVTVNICKSELPLIYMRKGKECYLDPIRQKLIFITPEETVRQMAISYLINELNVPAGMISVEQHLSHYGIKSKRRADIVIHAVDDKGDIYPLAVIECKAPDVYLDEKTYYQMVDYADLIGATYVMCNNGVEQKCFKYESDKYIPIEDFPTYEEMIAGEYTEWDIGTLPERIPFESLKTHLLNEFKSYEADEYGYEISKLTPMELAVPAFNFLECLLDTRVRMKSGDYGLFRLIEDYGVRMLSYGNASGGSFYGPYRSFLVEVDGSTEFYSIGITTYWKSTKPDEVKTCIVVAHDNEKETHHALQLVVEDNVFVSGNKVDFLHHGKIAVGNLGSGKIEELRMFVADRYPKIIRGNKFYLGTLTNDRLWNLQDAEIVELVVNLISYSMIRDEYREYVKQRKR